MAVIVQQVSPLYRKLNYYPVNYLSLNIVSCLVNRLCASVISSPAFTLSFKPLTFILTFRKAPLIQAFTASMPTAASVTELGLPFSVISFRRSEARKASFITVGGTWEAIKAWRRKMRKKMKNKRFGRRIKKGDCLNLH